VVLSSLLAYDKSLYETKIPIITINFNNWQDETAKDSSVFACVLSLEYAEVLL
jgi:hypothetical protein